METLHISFKNVIPRYSFINIILVLFLVCQIGVFTVLKINKTKETKLYLLIRNLDHFEIRKRINTTLNEEVVMTSQATSCNYKTLKRYLKTLLSRWQSQIPVYTLLKRIWFVKCSVYAIADYCRCFPPYLFQKYYRPILVIMMMMSGRYILCDIKLYYSLTTPSCNTAGHDGHLTLVPVR